MSMSNRNVPYIDASGNQVGVDAIMLPDGKWYTLKEDSFSLFMDWAQGPDGKPFPGTEALHFVAELVETGEPITGPYASILAMKV